MKLIVRQTVLATLVAQVLICKNVAMSTPWNESYFPNTSLITQDRELVRFFDDVIKDKIVVLNFIYTRCPDTCPLETAQLVKVQQILGDRMGKDIFFYSITIDPENDTPSVLKEYKERFGAHWTFLTGQESDITELRKKLGLYIDEIQDGSNNHNVSMIIGNQSTGRWMKRSPFENAYVLAEQIGNWLPGWIAPPKGDDYANAPKLRNISRGEQLFRTRCATCHTVGGGEQQWADGLVGPDLLGVTEKRDRAWLSRWLKEPDKMLAEKDPIAIELFAKYNNVSMPNMRLTKIDVAALIRYLKKESHRVAMRQRRTRTPDPTSDYRAERSDDVVAIMNAWIREAHPKARVNAGYMTLINVGNEDLTLVEVRSDAYEHIELHEMAMVDGLMKMRHLPEVVIPAGGQARFEPGGPHLMLMDPQQHLTKGQKTEMTLVFRSGEKQVVSFTVADK